MRRRSTGSAHEEDGEDSELIVDVDDPPPGAGIRSKSEELPEKRESRSLQTTARRVEQSIPRELDRRKSTDQRPSTARSRRPSNTNWKLGEARNGNMEKTRSTESSLLNMPSKDAIAADKMPDTRPNTRRQRLRSPWACSLLTFVTTIVALLTLASIIHSYSNRQLDAKGCRMSYMRPSFAKLSEFDTEHTRFASKYSVYLYREGMVDEDTMVG